MSKTLVCVNVLDSVSAQVYGSHCQEWFRLGRNTSDEFILFHPNRFSIDNARNQAANFALRLKTDYIYFVDDDIVLTPNTYSSLKEADADIAQALTYIRGYPFHVMAFNTKNEHELEYYDNYEYDIKEDGTVDCEAVGFSAVLIRTALLSKINAPYFVTASGTTEDVYFCMKCRQVLGRDVKIVMDTKVPTGHLLAPEVISKQTYMDLKYYYRDRGFKDVEKINGDRGKEYLEQCKGLF